MKKNEVIHYENGKRVERIFYRSGELMYEIPFVNDKKHGIEKEYYENGQVRCEIPFDNGNRHGMEKEYDENGNIIKEIIYENGELKTGGKNEQNRMD